MKLKLTTRPIILSIFILSYLDDRDNWGIDDLLIGGNLMATNILQTNFEIGISEEDWLFYPGGQLGQFCPPIQGEIPSSLRSTRSAGKTDRLELLYLNRYQQQNYMNSEQN